MGHKAIYTRDAEHRSSHLGVAEYVDGVIHGMHDVFQIKESFLFHLLACNFDHLWPSENYNHSFKKAHDITFHDFEVDR